MAKKRKLLLLIMAIILLIFGIYEAIEPGRTILEGGVLKLEELEELIVFAIKCAIIVLIIAAGIMGIRQKNYKNCIIVGLIILALGAAEFVFRLLVVGFSFTNYLDYLALASIVVPALYVISAKLKV